MITFSVFSCTCPDFSSKKSIEKLIKSVDVIIVGTVVEHINVEGLEYVDLIWESDKRSQNVIVRVDKIIKGEVKTEYISINQLAAGNCAIGFEYKKQYLITGDLIEKFIDSTPKENKNRVYKKDKIPFKLDIKIVKNNIYVSNLEYSFEKWNLLSKEQNIVSTNACITGKVNSYIAKLILKNI